MFKYATDLTDYNIDATDGEMGKIKDLYFDDDKWAVRYAVVDTRKWLPSKRVLLSPSGFERLDPERKRVEVKYDKDKVRHSPTVPEDTAITPETEISLAGYYGWNRYWMGNMMWGVQDRPITDFHQISADEEMLREEFNMQENRTKYNLRSVGESLNYRVHGNDGKLGKVVDLVVSNDNWKISYIVIHLDGKPIGDHLYTIDPDRIQSVDWFEGDIYVDYKVEELKEHNSYKTKEDVLAAVVG